MLRAMLVSVLCLSILIGCERRQSVEAPEGVSQTYYDSLLVVPIDMSGSYVQTVKTKAFPFFSVGAERFFRERLGANDKICISQLSKNADSLLWDGSPRAFRSQFSNAAAFRTFIDERADPAASRIHDGIADALEYVLGYPGVREGKTRVCVLVFSDMEDTFPDAEKTKARLNKLLGEYSTVKGCIGLYWVEPRLVSAWRQHLRDSGIKNYVVESAIVADPSLPTFED